MSQSMALLAFVTFLPQAVQGFVTFLVLTPPDAVGADEGVDAVVVAGVEGPGCE